MKRKRQAVTLILCSAVVLNLSGCALLQVPAIVIGETFKLVGQVLKVVAKMPKPPPGVF